MILTNTFTRNAQPNEFHTRWMHRIPDRRVRLDISDIFDVSDPTIKRCTSLSAFALELYHTKDPKSMTVSQSLTAQFLGPSNVCVSPFRPLVRSERSSSCSGDRLRLVGTTVVVGGRARTMYCEVHLPRTHIDILHAHIHNSCRCGP